VLEKVAFGLVLLAVPGVVITAVVTGLIAAAVFDLPLSAGLLVGAALAPTDPAILVPLFERMRLRPKVKNAIIAESALNDPTGAVLALAVAGIVLTGSASLTEPMVDFLVDLGISTGLGVLFGVVLSAAVSSRRAGVWRESASIAVLAVVAASFVSIDFAGGSGYLGAFLAGLIVGNMDRLGLAMHTHHERDMRVLASTVANVTVILVFVTVGANLPWRDIADDILPALAVLGGSSSSRGR
jgi:cell volume regulation protein A